MSSDLFEESYVASSHYDAEYYEREIERYLQESLDSTERSLQHLESSERVGIQTAQDLLEQREKLERIETDLEQMKYTMQSNQRNLNSLKSFVGGYFKNKFSRKPTEANTNKTTSKSQSKSSQHLEATVTKLNSPISPLPPSVSYTLSEPSRAVIKGSRFEAMDNQIDENIEIMSNQLRRLRELSTNMGQEIKGQNILLDDIDGAVAARNETINSQQKQMNEILGEKKPQSEDS